jgi:hypothetical protein
MPNPEQNGQHDDVAVAAIKDAYQQIGRADMRPPRVNEPAKLQQGAARHPSDGQKRLAAPGRRSSGGGLVFRGIVGLLIPTCIGAGAIALWSHGDAARQVIAAWAPPPGPISLPAVENPVPPQPSPPAVQVSAATPAPPQQVPPAQTVPEDAVSTSALPSPTPTQPLQSMASDLAAMGQEIEQLKASIQQLRASQEQLVRDNAEAAEQVKAERAQMARDNESAAEQLKATQEQMAHLIAKVSEQNLQPKTPAPRPRPIALATSKPASQLSSPQARARPVAATQASSEKKKLPSEPR